MFINKVYYNDQMQHFSSKRSLRDRYVLYLNDLYRRYNQSIQIQHKNVVYFQYHELLSCVFDLSVSKNTLSDIDCIIFVNWQSPIDTSYTSNELSILQLDDCKQFFDVRDSGSLCLFRAISILKILLQTPKFKKGLILQVESESKEIFSRVDGLSPEISFISSMVYSDCHGLKSAQIKDVLFNYSSQKLLSAIKAQLVNINKSNIVCYFRESSITQKFILENIPEAIYWEINKISFPTSSGFLVWSFNKVLQRQSSLKRKVVVVIDKDHETEQYAAALFFIGK